MSEAEPDFAQLWHTLRPMRPPSRPCQLNGVDAPYSICGGYADGNGGGVLFWCYTAAAAVEGLLWCNQSGHYLDLKIRDANDQIRFIVPTAQPVEASRQALIAALDGFRGVFQDKFEQDGPIFQHMKLKSWCWISIKGWGQNHENQHAYKVVSDASTVSVMVAPVGDFDGRMPKMCAISPEQFVQMMRIFIPGI